MKLKYPVKTDDNPNPTPYVDINIPYHRQFGMHQSIAEYQDELFEVLGIEISTIFELVETLGELLRNGDILPEKLPIILSRFPKSETVLKRL